MKTTDIIKTIYNYYPKNIGLDNIELYTNSPEYINRVKKCEEARLNDVNWRGLKKKLNNYALIEYKDVLYDYSVLGNTPCYSASMGFGLPENRNSWMISILISVITPLWAYRIIDFDQSDTVRYNYVYQNEATTVIFLQSLITKHFPSHTFIDESQHQIVILDISTAFKSSPSIFEAIFKEDLN